MSVLCAMSVLSACSGGDAKPDKNADPTTSSTPSKSSQVEISAVCRVKVAVTGSVEVSWTGRGTSQTMGSGPAAFYSAAHDGSQIAVYAKGEDFPTSANITSGQDTFTTPLGDDTGLDVKASGQSARVDADAVGIAPDAKVHITASFDC